MVKGLPVFRTEDRINQCWVKQLNLVIRDLRNAESSGVEIYRIANRILIGTLLGLLWHLHLNQVVVRLALPQAALEHLAGHILI